MIRLSNLLNSVAHGDCLSVMQNIPSQSIDFILTDPPYLVDYRDRSGRSVLNDNSDDWLKPAYAEMHRVLKNGSFCVSFYGYDKADRFISAWRAAGFRIAGHLVFPKNYASSAFYLKRRHECAYLLVKGWPRPPTSPAPDVLDWRYTGNRLHPTQKPISVLLPLVRAFTAPGDIVLDPFCGSGSTLVAAKTEGRQFVGIELDETHWRTASRRIQASNLKVAK